MLLFSFRIEHSQVAEKITEITVSLVNEKTQLLRVTSHHSVNTAWKKILRSRPILMLLSLCGFCLLATETCGFFKLIKIEALIGFHQQFASLLCMVYQLL